MSGDHVRSLHEWFSRLCGEGVTRRGEFQPCDKPTVAFRIDPNEGLPYAVCAYHCRADMVPLADVLAATPTPVTQKETAE